MLRRQNLLLLGALVALAPRAAWAQTEAELATRRELLTQAQQRFEQSDFDRALDLAQRAGQIQMTPSVRAFLADTQRQLRHYVEAQVMADRCVREANADERLTNRERILALCTEVSAEARSRASRVVVEVPANAPADFRVLVNGQVLNPALYGVSYLVNPGTVLVAATATGRAPFEARLEAASGAEQRVTVVLREGSAPGPVPVQPPRPVAVPRSGVPGGAIALLAVGGGGVLAGGVFAGLYASSVGNLNGMCTMPATAGGNYQCDPAARGVRDQAQTFGNASVGLFAGGAAVMLGGVLWAVLGGPRAEVRRAWVVPAPGGAAVGGAF